MAHRTMGQTTPSLRRAQEMVPTVQRPGIGLWFGWVAANVVGTLLAVGLGAAAVWAVITIVLSGEEVRVEERMVAGLAMVAVGTTVTAFVLGFAQFRVIRRVFWLMRRGEWVSATAVGLAIVWVLAAIPFAVRVLLEETELGEGLTLTLPDLTRVPVAWLGLALGIIVGAILGTTQRVVLKRYIQGAKWWVPAHIVGWALGLMVASLARDTLISGKPLAQTAPVAVGWLAVSAAIIGALNGFVLVWLARRRAEAAAYQ